MQRTTVHIILVITLSASLSCAQRPADPVERLLEKHADAMGGLEVIRSINTVVSTSGIEFSDTGMRGTITTHSMRPCLSFMEISLGYFNIRQGFDGVRIWMVDQNNMLQFRRDPGSREHQVSSCLMDNYDYLFPSPDFKITAACTDTIDGAICEVLEIVPVNGAVCSLSIDTETYLARSAVITGSAGTIDMIFDDYRPVAGVMFPFHTLIRNVSINQTIEIWKQSIAVNTELDPAIFLPPAIARRDYRFTDGSSSENIPFRYLHRHLYLPVTLDGVGRELMFLLDSGAGMTLIDSVIAAELELPHGGTIPGAGAGGTTDFHLSRIPGFSVEGIEFDAQIVITYPIAGMLERFVDLEIGGVLGYDFLSRFVTRIDYENRAISFFEPDSFSPAGAETSLDAPLMRNIFSLGCRLDSIHTGTFLLDTGANSSMLQKSFIDRNELTGGGTGLLVNLMGTGGEERADLRRFGLFELGDIGIDKPVFALPETNRGIGVFDGMDGIVGNDILEQFTVTLDYQNQRCLFEANGNFGRSLYTDRSGLQLIRGRGGTVSAYNIIPGSPADEAGLIEGDRILGMNGKDIAEFENLDEITGLLQGEEDTTIDLEVMRNGGRRQVRLVLRSYL